MKKKFNLKDILQTSEYAFEKYQRKIRVKSTAGLTLDVKDWPEEWKTVYFKAYPRLKEIILPRPKLSAKISLTQVLTQRRSVRQFSAGTFSSQTLSSLLYYSAGLQNIKKPNNGRFYPSGGARYPLEAYVVSLNSQLPMGLYHYYLKDNSLEEILTFKKLDLKRAFTPNNYPWVNKAAVVILITSVMKRTTIKYEERGYLLSLLEAGYMGQNFYLVSVALGLGCCALAGVGHDYWEKLLDIENSGELLIYALAIGNS